MRTAYHRCQRCFFDGPGSCTCLRNVCCIVQIHENVHAKFRHQPRVKRMNGYPSRLSGLREQ